MSRITLISLLLLTACAKSKPAAQEPSPTARTAAELAPMCERYFARQRTCSTEYLGALIDVRVEYDMPKGIAAHVQEAGRDAVVAEARVEWERDSAPEKVTAICQQMAERTPAEHVERLLKDGEACEATTDCATFATCAVNTERTYIKAGMQH